MKLNIKKICITAILIIIIIIGVGYFISNRVSNKKDTNSKDNTNKESETISEDYSSMGVIELKTLIDEKEEEIGKINDEFALLNEEYNSLSEQLRELSEEEAENLDRKLNENNNQESIQTDKSSSDIIIEESDSDEVKIQKIKEKMEILHLLIEKQNKNIEERALDLNKAYDEYAKYSTAK